VVISGPEDNLRIALELAHDKAKRIIPLRVSGAFHSRLMQGVREEFSHVVTSFPISDPFPPVISNVKAEPLTKASEIKEEVIDQLSCPVRWQESVEKMITMGVDEFWEVGPGEVLCGLIRRVNKMVGTVNVERCLNLRER
jgi:[acyl-carrier-protein] S-malonyltransferase